MGKIRLGFIGVGSRGGHQAVHVENSYPDRAEIVALADIDEENLDRTSGRLRDPKPETYTDWKRLISRDDVDAVCISTPQFAHCEMTVSAFQAGKHVYCEKPLALTVADCNAMIEAGERAGRAFMVGQQMRYHQHLNRMSQLIDQGEIGIIGDSAMITTEGFHLGRNLEIHYSDRADVVTMKLDPSRGPANALFERGGNWGIWVDFFNCIERGGKPVASGEVGRDALAVALAAERSIETGRPVWIREVSEQSET